MKINNENKRNNLNKMKIWNEIVMNKRREREIIMK
jgi:hypothetical protein